MFPDDSLTIPKDKSDAYESNEKQSQALGPLQVIRWVTVPESAGGRSGSRHQRSREHDQQTAIQTQSKEKRNEEENSLLFGSETQRKKEKSEREREREREKEAEF